eukprot:CAMPEP_0181310458 /NCGR_PEP_ID=MMETSP1101-20121128/12596_1 /TAXON_ID=46948 /ORGANISM="Rhodomonas abbreviata, Strain Caron Lab Isolate" /LENGTH=428 /DNA_ID=CAMNT_0023417087 /DNA_START=195 /DNA_END=1478 /DNA_ORIENTATION=-
MRIDTGEASLKLVRELVNLGFDAQLSRKAVDATHKAGVEQAVAWIARNEPAGGESGGGIMNNTAGKEKSLDFLTHALAEVGFSPAHARRACLATNLAGVPQAIEWALAHLDEETNANNNKDNTPRRGAAANRGAEAAAGFGSPGSTEGSGLVVELPDGKLFKLSNPNGRVVEMPNGSVVEMLDGQVVEMSNGQQLEMVDGSLLEIRPATIALDDGETVGHRIIENRSAAQVTASAAASASPARPAAASSSSHTHAAAQPQASSSSSPTVTLAPSRPPVAAAEELSEAEQRQLQAQEERLRQHHMQVITREKALNQQAQQLTERDKAVAGKQQQLAQHQQGLREQQEQLHRQRQALQTEQEEVRKQAAALKKKEQDLADRERLLQRKEQDVSRAQMRLQHQDKELKDREAAVQVAAANGASGSSTVSAG